MANSKTEILPFAVDNASDCESYLFLNHPTTFISLTTDSKDEHHLPPCSPKSTPPRSILKPSPIQQHQTVTFAAPSTNPIPALAPAPIERKSSTSSTTSTISEAEDDGYLGGGALRHIGGSHHLRELVQLAELDQQAKAKRQSSQQRQQSSNSGTAVKRPQEEHSTQGDWLAGVMQCWPEDMEMMEHEWTEEFYD